MKKFIDTINLQTQDFHMHTTFSDGSNTPAEMLYCAINSGMERIGISDHSYTHFDESYCMQKERISEYKDCINSLKAKVKEDCLPAELFLGIEQDYYSEEPTCDYDYVIGSVHYVRIPAASFHTPQDTPACAPALLPGITPGSLTEPPIPSGTFLNGDWIYIPVDETPEILKEAVDTFFSGDIYSLCELYYDTVSDVAYKTHADIIGHFDLISKFNDGNAFFDPAHPRYIAAWKKAAGKLCKSEAIFEINTGAIAKGYKKAPYPSYEMITFIQSLGGRFIYSSDAHSACHIGFNFGSVLP